ncbi:MAG TPA: anhydro-N-acetylmuramic acid kinase [Nitrospiria bacterium]|nr:anhydro-N-acetylmuramic acid kinase [Nitrospiria bacterium]
MRAEHMRVVGLMSGTSMDGIDAALVDIGGTPGHPSLRLLAFQTTPYAKELRTRLLRLSSGEPVTVADVCRLNARLGEEFAAAALRIIRRAGVSKSRVTLIGSHGQTVCHLPEPEREGRWRLRSTLQLGEPSTIAERTGLATIADFRPRDQAAGGHGAPLTPLLHDVLFRHPTRGRVVVNIGGISNMTFLRPGGSRDTLLAFDSGPGNMLLDAIVLVRTRGRLAMDAHGRLAGRGSVCRPLLDRLMAHPFLRRRPPKTTGRETFGLQAMRPRFGQYWMTLSTEDLLATATLFTARSIVMHCERFLRPRGSIDDVIVGGGGSRNPVLMRQLQAELPASRVATMETYGFDSRAIEAMAFALLAYETLHGRTNNIPAATGAARPVVMGKILPGKLRRGKRGFLL